MTDVTETTSLLDINCRLVVAIFRLANAEMQCEFLVAEVIYLFILHSACSKHFASLHQRGFAEINADSRE